MAVGKCSQVLGTRTYSEVPLRAHSEFRVTRRYTPELSGQTLTGDCIGGNAGSQSGIAHSSLLLPLSFFSLRPSFLHPVSSILSVSKLCLLRTEYTVYLYVYPTTVYPPMMSTVDYDILNAAPYREHALYLQGSCIDERLNSTAYNIGILGYGATGYR